jgi:antitoxin component HigA of HigAB toxin-antitoxin module
MLAFVGLKVLKPITNRLKYKAALQEIKHYLSFKNKVQVEETEYVLEIING